MRSTRKLVFAAILVFGATAAQAQEIDDHIRGQLQAHRLPGLSLVVLKDGKIIKAAGYGLADVKAKTPATAETVYKIGSVSKNFIATGIMLLVQTNRLGLDDPINKFLDGAPQAWSNITIRHLLTHTGGLVRESPGFDPNKIQSDAIVIRAAYGTPLRFQPGESWEYSNLGYFILAEVIHKVSGQSWSEFLKQNVFSRAGMNATRTTTLRDSIRFHARGYSENSEWRDAADWRAVRPSGAFISTVLDLAKWDSVLYTNDVLNEASRRQMWTPVTLTNGRTHGYGFGWHVSTMAGRKAVYHGGGLPGFVSHFVRFPDDGLSIIVLTNIDDVDMPSVVEAIARLYLPRGGS